MGSDNLDIEDITTSQSAKEVTANTQTNKMDNATQGEYNIAMSDANFDLSADLHADSKSNGLRFHRFKITGTLTADRLITISAAERGMSYSNETTGGFSVRIAPSGALGVLLPNGQARDIGCDGTDAWFSESHAAQPLHNWSYNRRTIANDGSDADHDIVFQAGIAARDSTDAVNIDLPNALTKQIDAVWAAGDDAGGLFDDGASPVTPVANTTWYHCFLIAKTDGTVDCGFDTSITAANIPTGYTLYAYIGSILTNGSANIRAFRQERNLFKFIGALTEDINQVDTSSPLSQDLSSAVTIPPGVVCEVRLGCFLTITTAGAIAFKHPDDTTLTSVSDVSTTSQHADLAMASAGYGVVDGIISDISQTIFWVTDATTTILDATVLQYRNLAMPA